MQLTQVKHHCTSMTFVQVPCWYFQLSSENQCYFWGKPTAFGCQNNYICNVLSLLICNGNLTEKKKHQKNTFNIEFRILIMEVLQVYREPTIVPNWPYATGGILSLSELFHIWNDHLPIQIHYGTTSDFNFGFFSSFPVYRNTNRWVYAGNNETFNSWCDPTMAWTRSNLDDDGACPVPCRPVPLFIYE